MTYSRPNLAARTCPSLIQWRIARADLPVSLAADSALYCLVFMAAA